MTAPLLTSLAAIRAHRPCPDGWATLTWWLDRTHGITDPGARWPLAWIIDSNGRDDAVWALRTTNPVLCRLIACDAAESVLARFEVRRPEDGRARHAIETARRFALGLTGDTERTAAAAAAASAAAASAAATASAWAAATATASAWAAATASAWAAAYAAHAASPAAAAAAYAEAIWTDRLRAWLCGHLPPAAEPYRALIHAGVWT